MPADPSGHNNSNALHVFDDYTFSTRPEVREERDFVAWPPSGYVPAQTVWGRWSFSLLHANFSSAVVTMTDDFGPVQVEVIERDSTNGAPESAIVWAVNGDTNSSLLPKPIDSDQCYKVTIAGVKISDAIQPPHEYATCILANDS